MKPMPTILQVLPALRSGGVERVTVETVEGLIHQQFGTHHVASSGGPYAQHLIQNRAMHHTLPLDTKNPFVLWKNAQALGQLIQNYSINLIHGRSRAPAWSAWYAARLTRTPFVTTYHGAYNEASFFKKMYNSIMARGDRVIAISHFIEQHIKKQYPHLSQHVICIPEGIDTDIFNPENVSSDRIERAQHTLKIPKNKTVILLPGRLTRWKGQTTFLKALHSFDPSQVHGILIGDCQGRSAYKDELQALSRTLSISFIDRFDDMPAAYACADIVCSCSTDPEAFGRITAESLAMERPYIGTNHGGSVELTDNGTLGHLVQPADRQALATALHKILSTPHTEQHIMGKAARHHIKITYSLAAMLQGTRTLYESIVKR
jgi:glycosyltransferase involved in cell wall biosynthesis